MSSSFVIPHSSLPALVESSADVWGLADEQLPASDSAPFVLTVPHTRDYHEQQRILDSIQARINALKARLGMPITHPDQ